MLTGLLFLSFLACAQDGKQYYFTHYSTSSGLISSEINTTIQDSRGFIWVGTNDGLQRYDGTRFRTFRRDHNLPASLPSNLIWQLLIDKKENLWVLTAEGQIGIFDTRNFTFHPVTVTAKNESGLRPSIKRLITDEYGNLFLLLMGNELLTWNEKQNEFSYRYNFFRLPPDAKPSGFAQQPGTRKYWISLQGAGFAIYNGANGHLSYAEHNADNEPAIEMLDRIPTPYRPYFDSKGRVWFQSWGPGYPEVYCYNLQEPGVAPSHYELISTLKTYYEIQDFFEKKDGSIWIGGLGVLAQYLEKEKKFELVSNTYTNERSIVFERINAIIEDRENNLWVATNNNGLFRFNPDEQFFRNMAHQNRVSGNRGKGSIMSLVCTRWGTLLAGSWGDGLFQYDKDGNLMPTNIRGIDNKLGPSVWCMIQSRDSNTIWASAQPGIYAINQATRSATFYNPPQLQNKTVRQIAEDRQGNLWLGLQGNGVFKWDASRGRKKFEDGISRFDKIPAIQINKITVDHLGWVWIATAAGGVYAVNPVADEILLHFDPSAAGALHLPEAATSAVMEYDDSTMVITTSVQIILYNRYLKRSLYIGTPETLSGLIASVQRDRSGHLWVSTTTGIYRVNPRSRVFIRFNRDDGIDNDHFTLSASLALPDGRLAFGSTDQFVIFDPAAIKTGKTPPQVSITGFVVMNKALQVDSLLRLRQVRLKHNNNSVVIEFSSLTYSSPNLIKYKLEGLDKQWRVADRSNQAVYSYLPSGKYTFRMLALDEMGDAGKIMTTLSIRVEPPFWKSWWFLTLLALAAGLFFFWLDRERMKRKEAIQRMRSDIAGNLHEQVNTALNNINILSEMARIKAGKDPEKSKEYIEQIHTKSHNMIIAMDDMLWSINPENDNMVKTTDRMREYIDALRNRYGVNIEMAVDKKVEALELNMRLRHEAFLLFKEGLKNLVTVGARNCHVYISLEKGNLVFTTQFETESCDMQQLNNLLHRQDLEKRLEAMQASIMIDVRKTNSVITLEVPTV